jgi:hypothetical protein
MANLLRFFFAPEDERAFFLYLERHKLEVYPLRIPPDWTPFRATAAALDQLPEEELYLAASDIGDVLVDKVKRGKDKGAWRVDEIRSPVIYYGRSRNNEEGELVSGKMWAELDVTPQTGRSTAPTDRFRRLYLEVEDWFKKTCRKSEPMGFFIGPHAARLFKEGLVLRDSEHRGGTVRPFR